MPGVLARSPPAIRYLDCEIVYSEDLNDGEDSGAVRVESPFR